MPEANFSGSSAYTAILDVNSVGGWALYGRKNSGTGFWSAGAQSWSVNINGQSWSGSYTYDYRNYSLLLIASGSYARPALGGNWGVSASVNMASGIGTASPSGTVWVDGTATTPPAPTSVSIDQLMPTSVRYTFTGNGDGGAGVDQWQAQIASDSAFTQNLQTVTSGGTTTFTGLTPGTTYYCRARGHNAVGWGAWANTINAMTASGAYVSVNGVWVAVPVYVSDGANWQAPRVQVSNGTSWQDAL